MSANALGRPTMASYAIASFLKLDCIVIQFLIAYDHLSPSPINNLA